MGEWETEKERQSSRKQVETGERKGNGSGGINREKQTGTQKDRRTDRQTDKETNRQIDGKTVRQTNAHTHQHTPTEVDRQSRRNDDT